MSTQLISEVGSSLVVGLSGVVLVDVAEYAITVPLAPDYPDPESSHST